MALEQSPSALHASDVVSSSAIFFTWLTAFFGLVPVFAAVVVSFAGAIYYFLAIYHHPAVRDWVQHRAEEKVLKNKVKLLKAQLALSQEDNMDREFWRKVATETEGTLKEIQEHLDARRRNFRPKSTPPG
jgi:hypothetical protein